jgi:hypothetical protein
VPSQSHTIGKAPILIGALENRNEKPPCRAALSRSWDKALSSI